MAVVVGLGSIEDY
jgi:hypothetical protein